LTLRSGGIAPPKVIVANPQHPAGLSGLSRDRTLSMPASQTILARRSGFPRGFEMRLVICALAAAVAAFAPGAAFADALSQAFQQVMRRPTDIEANLNYARLAEAAGKHRWALATYERVLANDPNNAEAQRGLQRMRRAIQPATTLFTAEIGGAWSSNPRQDPKNARGEAQGMAALSMLDERPLGETRWRTSAAVLGIYHGREHDLNYASAGFNTGPVIDLMPGLTVNPAVGGAGAYFDDRWYYGEGVASVAFEGHQEGAYRAVRFRAAYRDYNDFFPTQQGAYYDITGKFSFPYLFGNSVAILTPWVRWSDMSGTAQSPNTLIEVQPGAYTEWGGKLELNTPVTDWLIVGGNIAYSQRHYRTDPASNGNAKRHDNLLIPGAMLLMPNLFAYQTGLRIDYAYWSNASNYNPRDYNEHIVSATVVKRF